MAPRRTGLGRGIGALIPTSDERDRPVDVFFPHRDEARPEGAALAARESSRSSGGAVVDDEGDVRSGEEARNAGGGGDSSTGRAEADTAAQGGARRGSRRGDAVRTHASTATENADLDARHDADERRPPSSDDARGASRAAESTGSSDRPTLTQPEEASDLGDGAPHASLVAVPGARLAQLRIADIVPNAQQPRSEFDRDALEELKTSIREVGVLQPVVVRPLAEAGAEGERYELVMGERRLRASTELGRSSIPAIVKDTADDAMLRDALLENLHRADLNPLEEASAYQQLLADFGITQEELSGRIGRSRPQISNTLRLLRLPDPVQARVAAGILSAGHARAVLAAGDAEAMTRLADRIVREELSVRQAEAIVAKGTRTRRAPSTSSAQRHQPYLDDVGARLGDRLSTSVAITLGRSRGRITIDFATLTDLNRILAELGEDAG